MAQLARQVGFDDVSLDLIFGAPGENRDSWRYSLDATLTAEPDHISAYSLIVEEGTRLAGRIRRGELPMTDEDDLADKYLLTEKILTEAGYVNYEVSNWARPRSGR
ncbi:coproporphyrinogen III oxidase, partial [Xanthomonas citri pv. citri]|nr:coproporphyrinogen III oxidase [Xanthomonas citri pv. citri]